MSTYATVMSQLLDDSSLSLEQANAVMQDVMAGELTPVQTSALLTALAHKGETADEMAGFAGVLRSHGVRLAWDGDLLDTCGTGGSGKSTANTSTMVAFVIAASGVRVAKHGNRASSGKCGSADVLAHLDVPFDIPPEPAQVLLEELGIVFLFAPRYHPAVGQVMPVRRELGFRTVFNFLGPLCNPAGAKYQLLGVGDRERAPAMARALRELGSERALLVHGEDGLDEITLTGPTRLWETNGDGIVESTLDLATLGIEPVEFSAIAGGDVEQNAKLFMEVLSGGERGPRQQHLALNAGAGLYVAGRAETIADGYQRAQQTIASGAAYERFLRYRDRCRGLGLSS
jgi:anthranilate phosphoribosyltransferase